MKKNILFLAFSIIGLTTGLAQVNTIDPIDPSNVDVVGPVKQLTVFQKIGIKRKRNTIRKKCILMPFMAKT